MTWTIGVDNSVLVNSIVDFTHQSTTLYNGKGAAYEKLADAIANVQKLDRNDASKALLNLADGVTATKYQNFTTTADITADSIATTYVEADGLDLGNAGKYTALKLTTAEGTFYMVFEQV